MLRLSLCDPEEQRSLLEGRTEEERNTILREPGLKEEREARMLGLLDIRDEDGLYIRTGTVEEARADIFQKWRARCREVIKSLSPEEKGDRSSPVLTERPDPNASGRRGGEAGDGSYLGLRSGFLSPGSSKRRGDKGLSGSGEKSRSRSPLSSKRGDGGTSGGKAEGSAPRKSPP